MRNQSTYFRILYSLTTIFVLTACSPVKDPTEANLESELASQIADAMASIDEGAGSSGSYASINTGKPFLGKLYSVLNPVPSAQAAACGLSTFSSCSNNQIIRTFNNCTLRGLTFSGNVTLAYTDATIDNTCSLAAITHFVTRTPSFTITGKAGGTLSVAKTGTFGQKVTRGANTGGGIPTFTFENDGIRRVITSPQGVIRSDFTTTTPAPITITGGNRTNRTISSGSLLVTNNLNSSTCTFAASSVSWNATCNCPTTGTFTSTCSNGTVAQLSISSCAVGVLTLNGVDTIVALDRCEST